MGQCNNCHNITCPFNGQCQSQQGNYTCICPTRDTCPPLPVCCPCWFQLISNKIDRISTVDKPR